MATKEKQGLKVKQLWSSFKGFRSCMASALKEAGAPKGLYQEVSDTDSEGDGVAQPLYNAFDAIQQEVGEYSYLPDYCKKDPIAAQEYKLGVMEDCIYSEVHDCVINMIAEYRNAWNYAPGHRAEEMDPRDLAKKVVDIVMKRHHLVEKEFYSKLRELKGAK